MSEEPGGSEKRQFERYEVETQVKFEVVMPAYDFGTTKDISQGGICMKTHKILAQGTIIRLEFDLPSDPPEHINAVGKVMWQRPNPDGTFLTGIKFMT